MSIYYVVRVFQDDPRAEPDYLGPRRDAGDAPFPLGVCGIEAAKHFLWKEEAVNALRQFMTRCEKGGRIAYGQVYHITEEVWGPRVVVGEVSTKPLAPPEKPEPVEVAQDALVDLDEGERLLAAAEACDLTDDSDHDDYHEAVLWFYENAKELLEAARERNRLNWLRMHPESCRAEKDCRNERQKGFITCEACRDEGGGGYFDVYRSYVERECAEMLDELLSPLMKRLDEARERLASSQPEEAVRLPGPESPRFQPRDLS